jgi:uncharacterized protein YoxC
MYVNKVTTVQQKTLDLMVLLMGGLGKVKEDYNLIIESIDILSKEHEGDIEVLEYLIKIKRAIKDLNERDKVFDQWILNVQSLGYSIQDIDSRIDGLYQEFNDISRHYKDENEKSLYETTSTILELHNEIKALKDENSRIIQDFNILKQNNKQQTQENNQLVKISTVSKRTALIIGSLGIINFIGILVLILSK